MSENAGLGLEYNVQFNVEAGGKKATEDIKALSAQWQDILDKQKLVIKMGENASDYDATKQLENRTKKQKEAADETEKLTVKEKEYNKVVAQLEQTVARLELALEGETIELIKYKGQLAAVNKELKESIAIDNAKADSIDKAKKSLKENISILEGMTKAERSSSSGNALVDKIKEQRAEIAEFEKSIKLSAATSEKASQSVVAAKNNEIEAAARAAAAEAKLEIARKNANDAKIIKDAISPANTKDVFGLKESSIGEVQSKIDKLRQSVAVFSDAAQQVGFNDEKLNGATRRANIEIVRLSQKLSELKSGFGAQSLDKLLQVNPKSIQEANALMSELARRRDALNRNDSGYINSISAINKKQAELSAGNAIALQQGVEKTKQIERETHAYQNQGNTIASLKSMAIQYLSIYEGISIVKKIAEVTGLFELQQKSLAAILRDSAKADEIFSQVKSLAVVSPFQLKDLVSYTKQLAAYRIETDTLFDTMKNLADVSAGLGVDMSRIILAYGQVSAASVLRGQELRQFTEAGIPLVSLLADKFTELEGRVVSTGEVFGKISEKLVPFQMVKDVFSDMTTEGGMFYNMQEIQADTLHGKISNLTDAFDIMFNEIGSGGMTNSVMKGTVDMIAAMARNWDTVARVIVPVIGGMTGYKVIMLATLAIEKARAAFTAESTLLSAANAAAKTKEAAAETRLAATKATNLIITKGEVASQLTKRLLSAENIGLLAKEQAAYTIRNIAMRAGVTEDGKAIAVKQIAAVLQKKGIAQDVAEAEAKVILATSTRAATSANVSLGLSLKALILTNPFGWIAGIAAAIGGALYAFGAFENSAAKFKKELDEIGTAGDTESANLQGRFVALADKVKSGAGSAKEQSDALKTLNSVYGDILPSYALTVEGLKNMEAGYKSAKIAIDEYTDAKTKEKSVAAIEKNYDENIKPTYDGLVRDLKDLGVSADIAKQAIKLLQDGVNEGKIDDKNAIGSINKILNSINGTSIDISKDNIFGFNVKQINDGVSSIVASLKKQKEAISDLNTPTNKSLYGSFAGQAKLIEAEISKAIAAVSQGKKLIDGNLVPFDESLYNFNERKAEIERAKLISFIERVGGDSYAALKSVLEKNKSVGKGIGIDNFLFDMVKRVEALDVAPVAKKVNEIIESLSKSQNVGSSQYNSFAYKEQSGADGESYAKTILAKHGEIKKSIDEINRANKDWVSNTTVLREGLNKVTSITKEEALNGYILNGQKVKGLKDELAVAESIMAMLGLIDKKDKVRKEAQPVSKEIEILNEQIDLIEQAKKRYEELRNAGMSAVEAQAEINKLYKDKLNPKYGLSIAFDSEQLRSDYAIFQKVLDGLIAKGNEPTKKAAIKLNHSVDIKVSASSVDDSVKVLKAKLKEVEDGFNADKKRIDLFKNIFDTTGDYNLAERIAKSFDGEGTTSIEVALKKALESAFGAAKLDTAGLFDSKGNVDVIKAQAAITARRNADIANTPTGQVTDTKVTDLMQKQLDYTIDFRKKEVSELLKGLSDFENYEAKRTAVVRKETRERELIAANKDLSPENKLSLKTASVKRENEGLAKINTEQFKGSELWQTVFGDLDKISASSINLLKERIQSYIDAAGNGLGATDMKEMVKILDELNKRTASLDLGEFFKTMFTSIDLEPLRAAADEANDLYNKLAEKKNAAVIRSEKANLNLDAAKKNGSPILISIATREQISAAEDLTTANKELADAEIATADATKAYVSASNVKKKAIYDAKTGIDKEIAGLNAMKDAVGGVVDAFYAVTDAMGIVIDPDTRAVLDAIVKGFGAMVAVLSAVAAVLLVIELLATPLLIIAATLALIIASFAIWKYFSLKGTNDQIATQKALVESLKEQYADLERAMKDALGTDWLEAYNKEVKNLAQTSEGIQKQIDLEDSKGKDKKQETIDQLKKDLKEVDIQREEQAKKLHQFVVGTDLTSAATAFAQAWLDAYKSFGNTTDAMSLKFKEMLNNMVVNTMLAKVMQVALAPVFTAIEEASKVSSVGGAAFTPSEVLSITKLFTSSTTDANANMTLIMEMLSASGINMRDTSTNLTGVSKGISGVTEDTALLLGGYLNSIRQRMFTYFDAKSTEKAFDLSGSMAKLIIAQNTQIGHLEGIKANTLRGAIASENLVSEIQGLKAPSATGSGFALKVNA